MWPDAVALARRLARAAALPSAAVASIAVTVVTLVYLPVFTTTYGLSDDYNDLYMSARGNTQLPDVAIAGGRPVSGLAQEFVFSLLNTPENLNWARFVGTLGLVATGLVLAGVLRQFGASPIIQVGAAIAVATMPSSQVIASWAIMFPVSWASALALAAGFSVRHVGVVSASLRRWATVTALLVVCMAACLANYQPSAMAMGIGVLAALVVDDPPWRVVGARLASAASGAVGGALTYLVVNNLLVRWRGITADSRTDLEVPTLGTLEFFFDDVLPRSLDPLSFEPRTPVVLSVVAFSVVGLIGLPGTRRRRLIALLGALSAVVCSYAASIVVADRWPSGRSRLSVDLAVVALVGVAGTSLAARPRTRWPRRGGTVAALVVVGALAFSAGARANTYFGQPQALELRIVRNALRSLNPDPSAPLAVIRPTWEDSLAPAIDMDEFGFPSMAADWGVVGLLQLEQVNAGQPEFTTIEVFTSGDLVPAHYTQILDLASEYASVSP